MITAPHLPAGCPWSTWTPPNVNWCEEELCAWVVNPADTWSNLAYVVFGLIMVWSLRRESDALLRSFGPVAIVVGILSGIFHASYTFFFQFFDFVAMFLFLFLPLILNLRRFGRLRGKSAFVWYLVGVAGMSALVPVGFALGLPIQALVFILILVVLGQEILARRRGLPSGPLAIFLGAIGLLAAGATFSALDLSRVFCDPSDHILQGHAIWHVLTAASLWVLGLYYARQPAAA